METVWLLNVESGEYEDWSTTTLGIFSTTERAKEAADKYIEANKLELLEWKEMDIEEGTLYYRGYKKPDRNRYSVFVEPYTLDALEDE